MNEDTIERLMRIIHGHVMPEEAYEDCPGMHADHRALVLALNDEVPFLDWRPIAELVPTNTGHIEHGLNMVVHAPEVESLDCNPLCITDAYWQDDGLSGDKEPGSFLGARYDMCNDEWDKIEVTPTHFAYLSAPKDSPFLEPENIKIAEESRA